MDNGNSKSPSKRDLSSLDYSVLFLYPETYSRGSRARIMKWKIFFFISVTFLFSAVVMAEDATNLTQPMAGPQGSLGLAYTLINSNEYSVSKGRAITYGNIVIPESNNGFPVTAIDTGAFFGCNGLTGITIPDTIVSIGNNAFLGCSGLTTVTIPGRVTSIGNGAFYHCNRLTEVIMSGSNPPAIEFMVFQATGRSLQIHVPDADAMTAYKKAPVWSSYSTKIVSP
jgi:hypothetical protein